MPVNPPGRPSEQTTLRSHREGGENAPLTAMDGMNAHPVSYRGRLVAVATRERVYLAPQVAVLEDDHPSRRMVLAMALCACDVLDGALPGPWTEPRARAYARAVLIPDVELVDRWHWSDPALAEHFTVPLEEIAPARRDVEAAAPLPGAPEAGWFYAPERPDYPSPSLPEWS